MSWTDLKPEDLAQVSYRQADRLTLVREPGTPKIVVDSKIPMRKGAQVLFLRVPATLHERVERLVCGPKNTALVALIEQALDELEAGSETWRVLATASQP